MKKISTAHILLLSVLILQVALSFVLSWSGIRLSTVPSLLVSQGTVILPFAIYCIVKRQNPFTLIRVKKISAKTALFSVLIAFASYPVAIFLNMLSMLFVENAVTKAMNDLLSLGLVPSLILIAALPAVVEETVFRGMLYNTYSMRRPLMAIILSAVLFGLMHGNLNQMPYTLFLGLVMAFLMEGADSILAPMIMHFTLNATSTILSWVTYDGKQSAAGSVGLRESLAESYRAVYEKGGMELTESQLETMVNIGLTISVAIYAVIAIAAGSVVFMMIYSMFRARGLVLKDVFGRDCSETAFVETRKGKLRKNRMIDLYVILFMVITAILCVLNSIT